MKFIVYLATSLVAASQVMAQTAGAAAGAAPAEEPTTLLSLIQSGGWAMIPLALMSILTVMLALIYFVTMRRGAVVSHHFMNTADVLLKKRDHQGLLAIANRHPESIARVVQRTLDFSIKNPNATVETLREIAQSEGQSQASKMQHRVVYLADIGMLAPMVGLLGTVFGIIRSFGVLASNASQAERPVLLAAGVSEALVATGAGLIIGIIAMALYAVFRNRVQRLVSELEIASSHVVALIASNPSKKRDSVRSTLDDDF